MSDQFHRHARQFHQQAHQQSVQRARAWQQDMFRHQRDVQAHIGAQDQASRDALRRRGHTIDVIIVLMLVAALAIGAVLLIHSGQLDKWFGSTPGTAAVSGTWTAPAPVR